MPRTFGSLTILLPDKRNKFYANTLEKSGSLMAALSHHEEYGGKCGKTSAGIRSKHSPYRRMPRRANPGAAIVRCERTFQLRVKRMPDGRGQRARNPASALLSALPPALSGVLPIGQTRQKCATPNAAQENGPQQFSARFATYSMRKSLRETARKFGARQLIGEFLFRSQIFPRSFPAAKTSGITLETRPSAHGTKIRPQRANCRRNPRKFFPS